MTFKVGEQVQRSDLGLWFGKTSPEPLAATEEKTSPPFLMKRSKSSNRKPPLFLCLTKDGLQQDACLMWTEDGALLGEYTMRSFGEYPSAENVLRLSAILEESPHLKYSLSAKACQGILNRAERRGKKLPEQLEAALRAQAALQIQEEVAATLQAEGSGIEPAVYDARGNSNGEVVPTITGDHQNRITDYTAICIGNGQLNQMSMSEQANTLDTMHDQQCVMVCGLDSNKNGYVEQTGALQAHTSGGSTEFCCDKRNVVRRLTPLECERLQGYPDGWTDIGEWIDSKGKKHKAADSPRYKALGNSIALPFWFWLLRRISAQYERPATLGSLFDGIGGFPLCWERCNGKGTALWASEIEEFPMAVTKIRFSSAEYMPLIGADHETPSGKEAR